MNKELIEYLESNDKDYNRGVELFKSLKVDSKKNAFFSIDQPETIHRNLLISLLANYNRVYNKNIETPIIDKKNTIVESKNLNQVREQIKNIETEITNGRIIIEKNPKIKYDLLPDELKEAYDYNSLYYPIISAKHAKIKTLSADKSNDNQRKELMTEIIEIQTCIKSNWQKIDNWYKNQDKQPVQISPSGKFSLNEIEAITDPAIKALSKEKRIDTNLKYIRTNLGVDSKKEELQKRIDELKTWGINYEERIGTNTNS